MSLAEVMMQDHTVDHTTAGDNSRRDFLKKAAVAGTAVWAAPMVVSSRAFAGAGGSLATDECVCLKEDGTVDRTADGVDSIVYRYTGAACNDPQDTGRCKLPDGSPGVLRCTDVVAAPHPDQVVVRGWKVTGSPPPSTGSYTCPEPAGDEHTLVSALTAATTTGVLVDKSNASTATFEVLSTLSPNSTFVVYAYDGDNPDGTPIAGEVLQRFCYHFSCSQPLCTTDKHASMTVVSYTVSNPCP